MTYNYSFEICSLIFLVMLAGCFTARRHLNDKQAKLFLALLSLTFVNILSDILLCFRIEQIIGMNRYQFLICNLIYYISAFAIPVFLLKYLFLTMLQSIPKKEKCSMRISRFFFGAASLFTIITAFYGALYQYTEGTVTYASFSQYLLFGYYVLCAFFITPFSLYYRKKMELLQTYGIIGICAVAVGMSVAWLIAPRVLFLGTGLTLILVLVYLLYENPLKYIDRLSGSYNRSALYLECRKRKQKKDGFYLYEIALDNFTLINNVFGVDGGNFVLYSLAAKLRERFSPSSIFRYGGDMFIILVKKSENQEIIRKRLKEVLESEWLVNRTQITISAGICRIDADCFQNADMAINKVVEAAENEVKKKGKGQYLELNEEFAKQLARIDAIATAIESAITLQTMEIHYQPIYSTMSRKYCSMEALARLFVRGYGYIPPEEFILIAERNGSIVRLGYVILEEVCRFVSENKLRERGILFVEVNMSVIQGLEDNFVSRVTEIISRYGLPMSMIDFEITESVALHSEERLIENMNQLTKKKMTFALDDYGSGYSNVNYIVDLPFSLVKLDKHLVWSAFDNANSRHILEYTILMFKKIQLGIVAEGIETQAQAEVMIHAGVDYIQGFRYAMPMNKENFLAFLEAQEMKEQELLQENKALEEKKQRQKSIFATDNRRKPDRPYTIAICTSKIQEQLEGGFVTLFCEMARVRGYFSLIFSTYYGLIRKDNNAEGQSKIYKLINYDMLDAVVILPGAIESDEVVEDIIKKARQHKLPVISVDGTCDADYSVRYDYASSFEAIVRHVFDRHRAKHVNFIAGVKGNEYSEERLAIYKKVLKEKGYPYIEERVGYGDFWEGPTEEIVTRFLQEEELPDAIICANDTMAMAACRVIADKGLRVPEDILVTGFDGIEMEHYHSPRLTTAIQDIQTASMETVDLLDKLMAKEPCEPLILIPHSVVFSQSCGCEPKSIVMANEKLKDIYKKLTEQETFEHDMYHMISELTDQTSLDDCLQRITTYIELIGCEYIAICLTEDYINDVRGIETEQSRQALDRKDFAKRMYRMVEGRHYKYNFKEAMFETSELLPDFREQGKGESKLIFYPIHFQERAIGYVVMSFWSHVVNFKRVNSFCSNIDNALILLRNNAGVKRTNDMLQRTNSELTHLYERDALTFLLNRYGFDAHYLVMTEQVEDKNGYIMVVSLDLDNLKLINDKYLHNEGDEALRTAARCITEISGNNAVCARFGGDEFIIAKTVSHPEEEKKQTAEDITNWMNRYNKESNKPYKVGISFGIETQRLSELPDVYTLIARADLEMYACKKQHKSTIRNENRYV